MMRVDTSATTFPFTFTLSLQAKCPNCRGLNEGGPLGNNRRLGGGGPDVAHRGLPGRVQEEGQHHAHQHGGETLLGATPAVSQVGTKLTGGASSRGGRFYGRSISKLHIGPYCPSFGLKYRPPLDIGNLLTLIYRPPRRYINIDIWVSIKTFGCGYHFLVFCILYFQYIGNLYEGKGSTNKK